MKRKIELYINYIFIKPLFIIIRFLFNPPDKLIKKMRFKGKFKVINNDKKEFYLYNNAFYLENSIFWIGIDNFYWEKMTRKIWVELSKKSETIFDVGANTGIFSVLSKIYNNHAKVVAFEPQPNIYKILKKNNHVNNFNIDCEKYGVSNTIGSANFYNYGEKTFISRNTTAGSLNKNWRKNKQQSISVDITSLDQYIKDNNITQLDLLKIDVETHEYEVLLGFEKYFKLYKPIIILEIQNRSIGENIENFIQSQNYYFYNINEVSGLSLVNNLGQEVEQNRNYLLCPKHKLNYIEKFIKND